MTHDGTAQNREDMADPDTVSLVVCTRNRLQSLRRCMEALFSTDADAPFELVIVDNASNDGTKEFLSNVPRTYKHVSVKVVAEQIPGKGRALNAGCRVSTGTIIAFTDDDCYVSPDYIRAIKLSFDDPLIGAVGGRILLYDPQDLNVTTRTDESRQFYKPYSFLRPGAFQGANLAFRRSVLEEIGGFEDRLGPRTGINGGEDTVAVASALWRGFSAMYDPSPTVYHHHKRKSPEQLTQLYRSYGMMNGAYFVIFICNPASRRIYCIQLSRRIVEELVAFLGGLFRGRWCPMHASIAEIRGALLFLRNGLTDKTSSCRSQKK